MYRQCIELSRQFLGSLGPEFCEQVESDLKQVEHIDSITDYDALKNVKELVARYNSFLVVLTAYKSTIYHSIDEQLKQKYQDNFNKLSEIN